MNKQRHTASKRHNREQDDDEIEEVNTEHLCAKPSKGRLCRCYEIMVAADGFLHFLSPNFLAATPC